MMNGVSVNWSRWPQPDPEEGNLEYSQCDTDYPAGGSP
jgi:hypothetical protein